MKKVIKYISPFRVLAIAVVLFGVWLVLIAGSGGPHGYGNFFGALLFFLATVILLLDLLINAMFKNAKSISYLIQVLIIAMIFGWIYFKTS